MTQPVTTEHLAELYAAANKDNSAYGAARRRYKQQQKATNRAELRTTMIRFYIDIQEATA